MSVAIYRGGSLKDINLLSYPQHIQFGTGLRQYHSGRGLGSFINRIAKFLIPILKSSSKSLLKETLTGIQVISFFQYLTSKIILQY